MSAKNSVSYSCKLKYKCNLLVDVENLTYLSGKMMSDICCSVIITTLHPEDPQHVLHEAGVNIKPPGKGSITLFGIRYTR